MITDANSSSVDQASAANDAEPIAPPEGKSAGEIHAANEAADRAARLAEQIADSSHRDSPTQFSLRDLFVLTTIVAVELAGLRWFGSRGLAAVIGFAAVVWLFIIAVYQLKSPFGRLLFWSLVIGYILALSTVLVAGLASSH